MKKNSIATWVVMAILAAVSQQPLVAQSSSRFAITRSVVANSGTTFSTSSRFQLGSTIAQPLAAVPSSSRFSIQGGFWTWQAPAIVSGRRMGDDFLFSFESEPGKTYTVEYTDSLSAPNWQGLPPVAGTGSIQTLSTPAGNSGQRFYRVREQ